VQCPIPQKRYNHVISENIVSHQRLVVADGNQVSTENRVLSGNEGLDTFNFGSGFYALSYTHVHGERWQVKNVSIGIRNADIPDH
jgi:hypothetical protein